MSPLSTLVPIPPGMNAGARSVVALTADDRLVAVDVAGFWRLQNDAGQWREANSMTLADAFEVVTQTSHFSLFKHPTQPSTAYAVNVDGVLKSTDKGRNWVYKFHPAVAGAAWGGFALAVGDPNHLAVGRGSRIRQGGVNRGAIHLSPDGGDHWYGPFDISTEDIYIEARSIAFRPSNDNKLYVCTNTGIFVLTIDWNATPPPITARDRFEKRIPMSGTGSSKRCEWLGFNLLAGSDELWLTMRHDPDLPSGSTVYNGGVLLNRFGNSPPPLQSEEWEIRMGSPGSALAAVANADPDRASQYTMLVFRTSAEAYVGTDVLSGTETWGVWKTEDNGGGWSRATDSPADLDDPAHPSRVWGDGAENDNTNSRFVALALSPDRNTLYAAGNAEIFKSTGADFAQKWTSDYSTFHTFIDGDAYAKDRGGPYGFRPNSVLVWDNGNRVVIGTGDRFGLLSKNGNTSWRQMKRTVAVTRGESGMAFVVDPLGVPNRLFGVVVKSNEDSGFGGVIRSTTGGLTWADWNGSTFPDVGALDIIAYVENSRTKLVVAADGASTNRGIYVCTDANPTSGPPVYSQVTIAGTSNRAKKLYRATDDQIYLALEKDDLTPGGIFRSTDGVNWTNITGNVPGRQDCLWVYGDPNDAKRLYIGCHGEDGPDGGVWRTLDATATPVVWEKIYGGSATIPGSPPNGSRSWTTKVTVDRQGKVYVCTTTATPSQTQANGLWVFDPNSLPQQWARFADRPEGLHSQNFSHAFIHPVVNNEFWLVTQQSGIYRGTWTP